MFSPSKKPSVRTHMFIIPTTCGKVNVRPPEKKTIFMEDIMSNNFDLEAVLSQIPQNDLPLYEEGFSLTATLVGKSRRPHITIDAESGLALHLPGQDLPISLGTKKSFILIKGSPAEGFSRSYYSGKYVAGEHKSPDCQSPDGVRPSTEEPISELCATCPKSMVGSSKSGKGRACRSGKLVSVVIPPEEKSPLIIADIRLSGPTLVHLDSYAQQFVTRKVAIWKFFTIISVDKNEQYPVLRFTVDQPVAKEGLEEAKKLVSSIAE